MIRGLRLRILPEEAVSEQSLKQVVARETGRTPKSIRTIRVLKRSIDARQRTMFVNVKLRVFINEMPSGPEYQPMEYKGVSAGKPVIVVGAGPGGLFVALRLIELGLRPVIVERGKDVRERKKDAALISRKRRVNGESNYSFGESGAGAYSDGKLYTRSKKRGSVDEILNISCQFGTNPSTSADAYLYIGTDKLLRMIGNIREQVKRCGGEVYLETHMDAFITKENEVIGIGTNTRKGLYGPVILVTGHSTRDAYNYLYERQIRIEARGIVVSVCLGHPQGLIGRIQYRQKEGRGKYFPATEYSFVTQVNNRGVYSFRTCSGGFVASAAGGPKQVVVNGILPSNRGSHWFNLRMVVEIRPEGYSKPVGQEELYLRSGEKVDVGSPLALIAFQEHLGEVCWLNGGVKRTAPTQRMDDFMWEKNSFDSSVSSHTLGLLASPLHFWMLEFVASRPREGSCYSGKVFKGFLTNEAAMIGVETHTSAPVRILRDRNTYQHVTVKGLFPCGKGAGYVGRVVSATIDEERRAEGMYNLESSK